MKIISKHVDYYDSVQAYGVDDHVVFVRNSASYPNEITTKQPLHPLFEQCLQQLKKTRRHLIKKPYSSWFERDTVNHFHFSYIAFCGELYPLLTAFHTNKTDKTSHLYHFDDYLKWVNTLPEFLSKEINQKIDTETLKAFFNIKPTCKTGYNDIFIDLKVPYFSLASRIDFSLLLPGNVSVVIELLPILKDCEFFKVIDPFSAYQQIEQYLSGVMGADAKEIPSIPDEYLVKSKGFYEKSFKRRQPNSDRKLRKHMKKSCAHKKDQ